MANEQEKERLKALLADPKIHPTDRQMWTEALGRLEGADVQKTPARTSSALRTKLQAMLDKGMTQQQIIEHFKSIAAKRKEKKREALKSVDVIGAPGIRSAARPPTPEPEAVPYYIARPKTTTETGLTRERIVSPESREAVVAQMENQPAPVTPPPVPEPASPFMSVGPTRTERAGRFLIDMIAGAAGVDMNAVRMNRPGGPLNPDPNAALPFYMSTYQSYGIEPTPEQLAAAQRLGSAPPVTQPIDMLLFATGMKLAQGVRKPLVEGAEALVRSRAVQRLVAGSPLARQITAATTNIAAHGAAGATMGAPLAAKTGLEVGFAESSPHEGARAAIETMVGFAMIEAGLSAIPHAIAGGAQGTYNLMKSIEAHFDESMKQALRTGRKITSEEYQDILRQAGERAAREVSLQIPDFAAAFSEELNTRLLAIGADQLPFTRSIVLGAINGIKQEPGRMSSQITRDVMKRGAERRKVAGKPPKGVKERRVTPRDVRDLYPLSVEEQVYAKTYSESLIAGTPFDAKGWKVNANRAAAIRNEVRSRLQTSSTLEGRAVEPEVGPRFKRIPPEKRKSLPTKMLATEEGWPATTQGWSTLEFLRNTRTLVGRSSPTADTYLKPNRILTEIGEEAGTIPKQTIPEFGTTLDVGKMAGMAEPVPITAHVNSYAKLREALSRQGIVLTHASVETPLVDELGNVMKVERPVKFVVGDGDNVAMHDSLINAANDGLRRMLAKSSTTAKAALVAEPFNQTVLADDENDDEGTRKMKAMLRSAIRAGTALSLVGGTVAQQAARGGTYARLMSKLTSQFNSFMNAPPYTPKGVQTRAGVAASGLGKGVSRLWFAARPTAEILRNAPDTVRKAIVGSQYGARDWRRAMEDVQRFANVTAIRAGMGPPFMGRADRTPTAFLMRPLGEGIDNVLKKGMTTRGGWERAIKTSKLPTADQKKAALAALKEIPDKHLPLVKKMLVDMDEARAEGMGVFVKDFAETVGKMEPYIVTDGNGKFLGRYADTADANKVAMGGNSRGVKVDPLPQLEEIRERFGPEIGNYFPHAVYRDLHRGYVPVEIIQKMPHLNPHDILWELERLSKIKDRQAARAGYENAFGPLTDAEYANLRRKAANAVAPARLLGPVAARAVPEEFFVRFYKRRLQNNPDIMRNGLDVYKAYMSAVKRATIMDRHLPEIDAAMSELNGMVREGKFPASAYAEVSDTVQTTLGRAPSFDPDVSRFTAKMVGLMYGAALFLNMPAAVRNVIGQTLLVGAPEMASHGVRALYSLLDPEVRDILSRHHLVRKAYPLGVGSVEEIFEPLRRHLGKGAVPEKVEASTRAKAMVAWDAIDLFGNFLVGSEVAMRQWAVPAAISKWGEKRGLYKRGKSVRQVFSEIDKLSEQELRELDFEINELTRKYTYLLEPEFMPSGMRLAKRIPVIGPTFTMFTNFPVNYINRYISTALDAVDPRMSKAVRMDAWKRIIAHYTIAVAAFGPEAIPMYDRFFDWMDEQNPGLGTRIQETLQTYTDYYEKLHLGRDMSPLYPATPLTDLFSARRIGDNPISSLVGSMAPSWFSAMTGADGLPAEDRALSQKFWGSLTQTVTGAPNPPRPALPFFALHFMKGGREIDNIMKAFWYADADPDLAGGPLSRRHDSLTARLMLGRSKQEAEDAKVMRSLNAMAESDRLVVSDLVDALAHPGEVDHEIFDSRLQAFLNRPFLAAATSENLSSLVEQHIFKENMTPLEKKILNLPKSTLQDWYINRGWKERFATIGDRTPAEQQRLRRLQTVFLLAMSGEHP